MDHILREQKLIQLFPGKQLLFQNKIHDRTAAFQGFPGDAGRCFISKAGIQGRHYSYAVLHQLAAAVSIGRDPRDAAFLQGTERPGQPADPCEKRERDDRLHHIQF